MYLKLIKKKYDFWFIRISIIFYIFETYKLVDSNISYIYKKDCNNLGFKTFEGNGFSLPRIKLYKY